MQQKQFIKINEPFICEYCKYSNPIAQKTCRDHRINCLCSKHVDKNPGDRLEICHGKLIPIDFDIRGGEIKQIIFMCENCKTIRKNKPAEDDNKEKMWEIMGNK